MEILVAFALIYAILLMRNKSKLAKIQRRGLIKTKGRRW